jgi:ankyrin repeat protein
MVHRRSLTVKRKSSEMFATIKAALHAGAAICALALLAGCGQFDGRKATTADTFSNKRVRALAEAAASGDVAKVDALVKQGVDVNAKGRGKVTPLLHCLFRQSREGYAALLKHKADPNVLDAKRIGVMHWAAMETDAFWIRTALEHGGKPNLINTGNPHFPNETPLYYAISAGSFEGKAGRPECVRVLIGAKADLNHENDHGFTPLTKASDVETYEIVLLLLEAGADFNRTNKNGNSFVDWFRNTREEGLFDEDQRPWFRKCVEFLESKGVDLKAKK